MLVEDFYKIIELKELHFEEGSHEYNLITAFINRIILNVDLYETKEKGYKK